MKWFRLYNEVYRDVRVQNMRPELFRFWINFLCVASEQKDRGVVHSEDFIARTLCLPATVVRRYCAELQETRLLIRTESGALTPNHWRVRQRQSDNTAKRKRSCRPSAPVEVTPFTPTVIVHEVMAHEVAAVALVAPTPTTAALGLVAETETVSAPRKRKPATPKPPKPEIVLPDWLDPQEWSAWLDMRKQIGYYPTEHAKALALGKLAKWRDQGLDISKILQENTLCSWRGLFLPFEMEAQGHAKGRPQNQRSFFRNDSLPEPPSRKMATPVRHPDIQAVDHSFRSNT